MDRGNVFHITALGATSTFAMHFSAEAKRTYGILAENALFIISLPILFGIYLAAYHLNTRRQASRS